jgi:integrase
MGAIPKKIAIYLGLPNASEYTGHCLRRSSASLLAEAGASMSMLKRHGGWRSTSVAEGYIESSLENKKMVSKKILGENKNIMDNNSKDVCNTFKKKIQGETKVSNIGCNFLI